MHRGRPRTLALLAPALALLGSLGVWLGLPSTAEAAGPRGGSGFDEGGYIFLTPGSLVLPFSDDFNDNDIFDLHPTYGWGFGGGYMFARGRLFKATVGGVFEHTLLMFNDVDFTDFGGHLIRVMPEARIGLGNNKVWGYGLFGAGPAGAIWVWDAEPGWCDDGPGNDNCDDWSLNHREGAPGFNVQFGGGVQGIIVQNFFLGGEFDVDLGFYFDDDDNWRGRDHRDLGVYTVAFEFILGWYF
jgi:hypothetical protein